MAGRFQEFLHGAGAKQVELQDTHKVLQSNIQVTQELSVTEQKIHDEGRVNLAHHGVLGVADEGLDLQILLDEAEEDLDLPALLVDIGDGLGYQPEVVGEEHINLAGFGVLVNDAAQRQDHRRYL